MSAKRLIATLFAITVLCAAAVPLMAEEGAIGVPVKCKDDYCVIHRDWLAALIEAHNEMVVENRELKAKNCLHLKKDRDS